MKQLFLILLLIAMAGCSTYSITKESLSEQIEKSQDPARVRNISSVGTAYTSNHLSKIRCINKDGHEVTVNPDKNTTFNITKTDETIALYYDTVYISNDSLFGLKSRIVGGKRRIALTEISGIKIKMEQ